MARKPRIHLDVTTTGAALVRGLCGSLGGETTEERPRVTCLRCRVRMRRQDAEAESVRRESYVNDLAFMEETRKPLDRTGSKRHLAAVVHAFSAYADMIIEGSQRPHHVKRERPYASPSHALAELVRTRLDGYPQRSLSDPRRLEALTGALGSIVRTPQGEDRAAAQADHIVHVERALHAAFVAPWDGVPELSPDVCRLIVVARLVGRRPVAEVAELLAERMPEHVRHLVTPRLVGRVTRHAYSEMERDLVERELCEPSETEQEGSGARALDGEADMSGEVSDNDLRGMKAIAAFLGVSERTARQYQAEGMPTYNFRGQVEAKSAELRSWRESQTRPSSAPARKAAG